MAAVTDDGGASQTPSNNDAPPPAAVKEDDELSSSDSISAINFGGTRPQQAFALLDGFDVNKKEPRTTIDITTIPAVLGRYNEGDMNNPNFFGLGTKKAFSRRHVSIYYRDKEGGRVEWDEKRQTTIYKDAKTVEREEDPNPCQKAMANSAMAVIESLGKNRIVVDKKTLYQGESMVLHSGSNISISTFFYVFLLPTNVEPKIHAIDMGEKRKTATKKTVSSKKRPNTSSSSSSLSSAAAAKKSKKAASTTTGSSSGTTSQQADLETLPVADLLEKMDEAVSKGLWDRKNQVIGATICYHAVRAAGMSPQIQQKVVEDGGVSRSDIMEWISSSETFGGWVQQMLTNMEPRSYQAAITKSLLKSGFARTTGAGRYIKWELPNDIPLKSKKKTTKKKKKPTASAAAAAPKQSKAAIPPSPIKEEPVSEPEDNTTLTPTPTPAEEEAPANEEQQKQQDDDEAPSRNGQEDEEEEVGEGEGDTNEKEKEIEKENENANENENENENANDPALEENNEEQPATDDSEMDVIV
eukprot:CAMPEP_0116154858 /NCGR_PEP_ID=MMETSP0329-20121206/22003_1 /TAXON_ID=697910 /ORGANISM="Pseudo-nitzschia arenysensis, Strain B593" /LENGTH=526 /DNA_ID=CAMNT_0003651863 /DNA_START=70 /DNA_END=1651 /DNA_ORIENTATION=-